MLIQGWILKKMAQSRQTSGLKFNICGYNTNPGANNAKRVGKVS